jgi:hypothetical protein
LAQAGPGDTVALATPGSTAHYIGNWTIDTRGTSPGSPITIEPATGVSDPVLDGNLGRLTGCTTTSCAGPVLTVGSTAQTGVVYVENVVYVDINGLTANGLTIEDGNNTTPTQPGVGIGVGSGTSTLGGGIQNSWGGILTVVDTEFDDNTANFGGAIVSANGDDVPSGSLTVTSCTFNDNRAVDGDGGAIDTGAGGEGEVGALVVTGSTFSGNSTTGSTADRGDGGAIDNGDESTSTGALSVSTSTFIDNTATVDGGAIDNGDNGGTGGTSGAPNGVSGSTFTDNSANGTTLTAGDGGAIDNADIGGRGYLTVSSSTFSANSASANGIDTKYHPSDGGAIDNADHGGNGHVAVSGSTFDGNMTDANHGGNSNGGAIDNADEGGTGTLTVSISTFVANVAQNGAYGAHGGAIDNGDDEARGTVAVSATTFDGDMVMGTGRNNGPLLESHDFGGKGTVDVSADIFNGTCGQGDGTGSWTDGGYNVGPNASCENDNAHDVDNGATLSGFLGPLASNGGETPTVKLLSTGDPLDLAIGIIPNPTASLCPATDQRGHTSAARRACDAGAFQTHGKAGAKAP